MQLNRNLGFGFKQNKSVNRNLGFGLKVKFLPKPKPKPKFSDHYRLHFERNKSYHNTFVQLQYKSGLDTVLPGVRAFEPQR